MKLPAWAVGDDERRRSTYPEPVCAVGQAAKLHLHQEGTWRALCGVVTDGRVDFLGRTPRPVCVKCRRKAEEGGCPDE